MNEARHIGEAGIDLLEWFEKDVLKAYRDSGGVLTIGRGHAGPDVHEGMVIDEARSLELFRHDLERFETHVSGVLKIQVSENEFDALVCFCFNVGDGVFREESCKLLRLLNAGDRFDAAEQFGRWIYDNGKPLLGLKRRRAAERALFLGLNWRSAAAAVNSL